MVKRRAIDRLTRRLVTCCGVAILLLMLLLFCWLIGVVLPLFNAPGLQIAASQRLWDGAPALAIGDQGKVGWRISERGAARFIPLDGQPAEPALALTPPPGEIVRSADEQTLLLNMQGALTLIQPTADQRWRFPLGDKPFHLPDGAVTKMALATRHAGQWRIAALTEAGLRVLTLGTKWPGLGYPAAATPAGSAGALAVRQSALHHRRQSATSLAT